MDATVIDRVVAGFPARQDGDLMLCDAAGVAYQRDMRVTASYDQDYWNKCLGYEDKAIARKINEGRIKLVNGHAGTFTKVLDVGIGSGEFIKKRPMTFGYDINPTAEAWLKQHDLWNEDFRSFCAFTFWDVIEHVPSPEHYFRLIRPGAWLFASLPIFNDLARIRESRHYRPGEHLYYWTLGGFVHWMALHRFALLETADFETRAGRDSIMSFAFRKIGA